MRYTEMSLVTQYVFLQKVVSANLRRTSSWSNTATVCSCDRWASKANVQSGKELANVIRHAENIGAKIYRLVWCHSITPFGDSNGKPHIIQYIHSSLQIVFNQTLCHTIAFPSVQCGQCCYNIISFHRQHPVFSLLCLIPPLVFYSDDIAAISLLLALLATLND